MTLPAVAHTHGRDGGKVRMCAKRSDPPGGGPDGPNETGTKRITRKRVMGCFYHHPHTRPVSRPIPPKTREVGLCAAIYPNPYPTIPPAHIFNPEAIWRPISKQIDPLDGVIHHRTEAQRRSLDNRRDNGSTIIRIFTVTTARYLASYVVAASTI